MRHWMAICEHYQTAVIRRREWTEGNAVHEEELFVVAQTFFFIYSRMQPRYSLAGGTPRRLGRQVRSTSCGASDACTCALAYNS
eukprot:462578-Prymnesium_polylepis.1